MTNFNASAATRSYVAPPPELNSGNSLSESPGRTSPDYRDGADFITYLRSSNDPNIYQSTISDLRQRLHQAYTSPAPLPSVTPRPDGGFNLVRTAPEVESIVLPGGGAKGIAYVGLMRALLAGTFPHVREFIGSSAGSLAATLMSFGDDPNDMQSMLANDLPKLLKTQTELREVYPSIKFQNTMSFTSRMIWKIIGSRSLDEANGFVKKLDEVSSEAASRYLNGLSDSELHEKVDQYCREKHKSPAERAQLLDRVKTLKAPADFDHNREEAMITFSDLDLLHSMNPTRFKDIRTTGFDSIGKTTKYFNVEETPNVPVAYAARLSMSHPLLAQGVQLAKHLDASNAVYIDGGIASNIPSEAVYDHDIERAIGDSGSPVDEEIRAKTVVMKFDESHEEASVKKRNIFTRFARFLTSISRRFKEWFMRVVSNNPKADINGKEDKDKFHAAGPNGYTLYHGDLRTTELDVSFERQERAINEASIGILAQALQRKDQGCYVSVDTLSEAVDRLSDEEKAQIQSAGQPTRESMGCDQTEQECEQKRNALEALQNDPQTDEKQLEQAKNRFLSAQKAVKLRAEALTYTTQLYELVRKAQEPQGMNEDAPQNGTSHYLNAPTSDHDIQNTSSVFAPKG